MAVKQTSVGGRRTWQRRHLLPTLRIWELLSICQQPRLEKLTCNSVRRSAARVQNVRTEFSIHGHYCSWLIGITSCTRTSGTCVYESKPHRRYGSRAYSPRWRTREWPNWHTRHTRRRVCNWSITRKQYI